MSDPQPKLLLVDETGRVLDVFQIDRYDLDRTSGLETLAQDIREAFARSPSDWTVKPELAGHIITALESARQRLTERAYMRTDGRLLHPTIRRIEVALHYLGRLTTFVALPTDGQRAALIDEMTLTAYLTEELGQVIDIAWEAVFTARDRGLAEDPTVDALYKWLIAKGPEIHKRYNNASIPMEADAQCASSY